MKIQIASDLHLEFNKQHVPSPTCFRPVADRNLLVLAGDICVQMHAKKFVLQQLETSPVIYVPGNHEYYCEHTRASIDAGWYEFARAHSNFHYLVAQSVCIDGLCFFGAPWYSDLWGSGDPWDWALVHRSISDFYDRTGGIDPWSVTRHINTHKDQTDLLLRELDQSDIDVVITHWPPTKQAIHPKYEGDELNPYFINDHEDLVRDVGARLWISGHTHEPYEYWVEQTRCVGNPAGYPGEHRESLLFRPDRIVEIKRRSH